MKMKLIRKPKSRITSKRDPAKPMLHFAEYIKILLFSLKEKRHTQLERAEFLFIKKYATSILKEDELLFDIGANHGNFVKSIDKHAPEVPIFSFEPLPALKNTLESLCRQKNNLKYINKAVGSKNGTTTINCFDVTELSSVNPMIDNAYNGNEGSHQVCSVEVITLDSFISTNNIKLPVHIKIDTQGYELEVLKGCEHSFERGQIKSIYIEMATKQKYQDQAIYFEIDSFLRGNGFYLFDINPFYHENGNQLTEYDAIYVLG